MREWYIGGTTISAVMGLNRWKTARQFYEECIGTIEPPDISKVEAVELGILLEDPVAQMFTKRTGMQVRRAPKRYVHQLYPYMSCQVDRLITGTDELLECKTAGGAKAREWEGEEIPIEYILQVQFQLMLTGRKVGWIAVLIGGNSLGFKYKKIEEDAVLQAKMIEAAKAFKEMVDNRTPPDVVAEDNPLMVDLYPKAGAEIAEAAADINGAVQLLQQTKAQIADLTKIKDECEAKIKDAIGTLQGIKTPEYTVKWINVKGSTYTVTKPDSRQLRVTKNKGDV